MDDIKVVITLSDDTVYETCMTIDDIDDLMNEWRKPLNGIVQVYDRIESNEGLYVAALAIKSISWTSK